MDESSITPAVLTSRTELKRKHVDIVDLSGTGNGATPIEERHRDRRIEDDELGGDDDSTYQDALDEIEQKPYVPGEFPRHDHM